GSSTRVSQERKNQSREIEDSLRTRSFVANLRGGASRSGGEVEDEEKYAVVALPRRQSQKTTRKSKRKSSTASSENDDKAEVARADRFTLVFDTLEALAGQGAGTGVGDATNRNAEAGSETPPQDRNTLDNDKEVQRHQ
ncbi:unnamed protein product, partial [Amoebophrya sp. A25]